ncbi:MAG: T9SS type A sorting domain-containing protein [Bacteroidales bacterium]|jgi:hypothetical protein|nr:T9SS type A sorting domain-containing protein [Bacteroidales bacterium]
MRKYIILALGILMALYASSQSVTFPENFDGNTVSFTASPASAWTKSSNYYTSAPYSLWGEVPHMPGDSIILTSPVYDFHTVDYPYVMFRFKHICKISPRDRVVLEYKISGQGWQLMPVEAYKGKALNYGGSGFNANSYNEWKGSDSTVIPDLSWWKEEIFDLGPDVGSDASVQFRFILKHGSTQGTEVAYGWLIDNIEVVGATYAVNFPIVEFIHPLIQSEVFKTGPYEINARVETTTFAPIKIPYLKYVATQNGTPVKTDSVKMDAVSGDALWKASIPQFSVGTEVIYSITGIDSIGNYTIATSYYTIQKPPKANAVGDSIVGTGTTTSAFSPYYSYYDRSWTRAIYYESEFNPDGGGAWIKSIAYNNAIATASTVDRLSIYVKATKDDVITVNGYVDPVADGATLVRSEARHISSQGWNTFPFLDLFYLPPGYNLMVYWLNNDGSYGNNGDASWYYTAQPVNNHIRAYGDAQPDLALLGNISVNNLRPNITISMEFNNFPDTSIALYSIDMTDTVSVTPAITYPVIATIKNKGDSNLTSATVYYSVNGVTQPPYNWSGNLEWDFNTAVTVGNYSPRPNQWDTIVVWVDNPNGILDGRTEDDTLTKIIYGSSDIMMTFVNPPGDTVRNTGPFPISARIYSITGANLGATIPLEVSTTHSGVTTTVTYPMTFDAIDNLWKTTIPHTLFGSDVAYSITLQDRHVNTLTIDGHFYIYRSEDGPSLDYVIIGTETEPYLFTPMNLYYENSWTRQLYLGSELQPGATGGTIHKLAWDYAEDAPDFSVADQICYMRAVSDVEILSEDWEDPLTGGGVKVWEGTLPGEPGWVEITLTQPFILPPGKNLMVYWLHAQSGYMTTSHVWNHTEMTKNMAVVGYCDCGGPGWIPSTAYNKVLSNLRPNARFYIEGLPLQDTSVALVEIESPVFTQLASSPVSVRVRIRNMGKHNLTDCMLNWSKNGTLQTPVQYTNTGGLPSDFTDTITIGEYIPGLNQRDTILVWVYLPNGKEDLNVMDDTLQAFSYGCEGVLAGIKTVGEDFPTLTDAINLIRYCGLTGDLTLLLKDTLVENVDLSNLTPQMNGYHLTITSRGNHPDSALIRPSTGTGVLLGNTNNITLKNITVDRSTGGNAIQFTGGCSNVLIRDCYLYSSATSTSYNTTAPIIKDVAGVVDNIVIINNRLNGGYVGMYLNGGASGTPNQYGTNVVFDSNTVSNQYYFGITADYVRFTSVSHNTIQSRIRNANYSWQGIRLNYSDGPIVGNRIIQRDTLATIEQPCGIFLDSYNTVNPANTDTALIANNEIIIQNNSFYSTPGGMQIYSSPRLKIVHNSIYVSGNGTTASRGMYFSDPFSGVIKNNNIVMKYEWSYPVYFSSGVSGDIDYNNYDAPTYIGYYGYGITTLAEWQQTVGIDINSTRTKIVFENDSINLMFKYNLGVTCPSIAPITQDITGAPRGGVTIKGCYEVIQPSGDLKIDQISTWSDEIVRDQTIQVLIDVTNLGTTALSSATFGWKVNDDIKASTTWTPTSALASLGQQTGVSIGSFDASGTDDVFNVVVWVESINGQPDLIHWNDTVSVSAKIVPLAEFVNPIIGDIIDNLSFTVNTRIRTETGAPATPPVMSISTIVNGNIHLSGSVAMVLNGNVWEANIPQQYYGSKVIYTTTISDLVGNSITLTDSTYIRLSNASSEKYPGYNLSILEIVDPVNRVGGSSCSDEYVSMKIVVANTGENDYDFSVNNVTFAVDVTNAITYEVSKTLNSGTLPSGSVDTIEIDPMFPIYMPGQYNMEILLISSVDHIQYDDTLNHSYISERLGLPIDETFSGSFPTEFTVRRINTVAEWSIVSQGSGADANVQPVFGSGLLSFTGSRGAMSTFATRQLELRGTVFPTLTFWYFHDTVASREYTDVLITTDGGTTYELLTTVYKQNAIYGWEPYPLDLSSYIGGDCINVLFRAMSFGEATQYIDRINITSQADLAISNIALPLETACDLSSAELQIEISTMTNQIIDLSQFSTSLAIEIPGYQTLAPIPLQKRMEGNSSDTIYIPLPNLPMGNYTIKVYLTSPVDNQPETDTAYYNVNVQPSLSVTVTQVTTQSTRINVGAKVWQDIVIENTGTVDISGIELVLRITGTNQDIVRETLPVDLAVGETYNYQFVNPYTVPADERYQVYLTAYMSCDSAHVNAVNAIEEYVDLHNLSIVSIDNPIGQADTIGAAINITVTLENTDDVNSFKNISIYAVIENEEGQSLVNRWGTIGEVLPSRTLQFTFEESYTVPDETAYWIRIYLAGSDNYPEDDTTETRRTTVDGGVSVKGIESSNVFTLSQNIPNPANNSTRINYSIPEAGKVVFHVHSVSGQLLYSETIEAAHDKQSIELNTSSFAAGIYFYSIEYKGQRLVKRMMISD